MNNVGAGAQVTAALRRSNRHACSSDDREADPYLERRGGSDPDLANCK